MADSMALFKVDDTFEHRLLVTADVMAQFRRLSGDDSPMHLDDSFAREHGFSAAIAYGNLLGAMVSRLVGVGLPTRKVVIARQSLDFRQPAYIGQQVHLVATVSAVHEAVRSVQLKLAFATPSGPICTGLCMIRCL